MSNRRNNGDSVRGPTSALTSFLKEKGIRVPNRNRFERAQPTQAPPSTNTTDVNEDATVVLNIPEDAQAVASSSTTPLPAATATSDATPIVIADDDEQGPAKKKQKLSAKAMAAEKKRQKRDMDDGVDDWGVPLAADKPPKGRYVNRTPGAFVYCAECGSKFTFTKYTPSSSDGAGVLCPPCQQENAVPDASTSAPAKKRPRAVKPKPAQTETPLPRIPTLQKACIHILGKNIGAVEELGDIGSTSLDQLCKIVCKNRGLCDDNLKLFVDVSDQKLSLYDCARLEEESYKQIAIFAPKLRQLTLNFCGSFRNDALDAVKERLHHLTRIELYGAFLVTAPKWIEFFDSFMSNDKAPLEGFLLRQSPRFDRSCILRIAENFPNLTELRLAEIQKLDDDCLSLLHGLKALTHLDISRAGLTADNLTDDGVVGLLEHVGGNLVTLVLDENERLGDRVLLEGIRPHCPKLRHLGLYMLAELLPTGIVGLFSDWDENSGLESLNISRCIELDDNAITSIVTHSGKTLRSLNMNSVDRDVTERGIQAVAHGCPELCSLNVGFVRAVDDFLMKDILDHCVKLEWLSVFGCNRVTDHAPSRRDVNLVGEGRFKVSF